MNQEYRLIWFQHFHKAAGTTVFEYAKKNGDSFWPNNMNGNPIDENQLCLELWNYSNDELTSFIDSCEAKGVTFIATEWGVPNVEHLSHDSRVCVVTCLRKPRARFVSNFYYDLYGGYTQAKTLYEYESSRGRTITMYNYYCRMLSGKNNSEHDVTEEDFLKAQLVLDKFDCCTVLEQGGLVSLAEYLQWQVEKLHINKTSFSIKKLMKHVLKGRFKTSFYYLTYPKKEPDDQFKARFDSANKWDSLLYEGYLK